MDILVRDGIYKRVEFMIQNILDILALLTKNLREIQQTIQASLKY
ncbi:MAG: hypothetical protein ACP6IP_09120 [Candidatus Njordarchaeia archaeon]